MVPKEWALAHLERCYWCWKEYTGFGATYAPIQTTALSGVALDTASIKTTRLHNGTVQVLNWPAFSVDHSSAETFGALWNGKHGKEDPGLLSNENGTIFLSQKSNRWSPRYLGTVKGGMLQSSKHVPLPTSLKCVTDITVKMSHCFSWNSKMTQFKHLIYFLCFIVNEICVWDICKSLHLVVILYVT